MSGNWSELGIPDFARMSLMKNPTKYQGYIQLMPFLSYSGKTKRRGNKIPPPRLGLSPS